PRVAPGPTSRRRCRERPKARTRSRLRWPWPSGWASTCRSPARSLALCSRARASNAAWSTCSPANRRTSLPTTTSGWRARPPTPRSPPQRRRPASARVRRRLDGIDGRAQVVGFGGGRDPAGTFEFVDPGPEVVDLRRHAVSLGVVLGEIAGTSSEIIGGLAVDRPALDAVIDCRVEGGDGGG